MIVGEKTERLTSESEAAAKNQEEHAILEGYTDEQVTNWTVGRCLDSILAQLEEEAVTSDIGGASAALEEAVQSVRGEGAARDAAVAALQGAANAADGDAQRKGLEEVQKELAALKEAREETDKWKSAEEEKVERLRKDVDAIREARETKSKEGEVKQKPAKEEKKKEEAEEPEKEKKDEGPPKKKVWEKVYDKDQGAHFYRNLEDGTTTWVKPEGYVE